MPYQHQGKSMAEEVQSSVRAYAHIFNSSQEQRPDAVRVDPYGGRPIGPTTYHVRPMAWLNQDRDGTLRATPPFLDRTDNLKSTTLSSEIGFIDPECYKFVQNGAPGSSGVRWSTMPQRAPLQTQVLDKFYDPNFGKTVTLERQLEKTPRLYAASFNSNDKRFKPPPEEPDLGPGKYDVVAACIQIKNPNRETPTFKSKPWYKTKPVHAQEKHEAPDMIRSSALARETKKWTQQGFAYSTRERFPRVRPSWNS